MLNSTTKPELRPRFLHHMLGALFLKEATKTVFLGTGAFCIVYKLEKNCRAASMFTTAYLLVDLVFSNFHSQFIYGEREEAKLSSILRRACVITELANEGFEPKTKIFLHLFNVIYGFL